jgi:hypothetical protein
MTTEEVHRLVTAHYIFNLALAQTLGLDWQRGERVNIQVGDRGFMLIYLHSVNGYLFVPEGVGQVLASIS